MKAFGGTTGATSADGVSYDNTTSGLMSVDVQAAVDEVKSLLPDTSESPIATEASSIAASAGSTLGLQQELLANSGQVALTPMVVGPTSNGKVQISSLGDGNVIFIYATGADYADGIPIWETVAGQALGYTGPEFADRGNNMCLTGLEFGSILVGSQGIHGITEIEGSSTTAANNAVMPLMPYGLSFDQTGAYAFRKSTGNSNDRGVMYFGNGPIASNVSLMDGSAAIVRGQDSVEMGAWGSTHLDTAGDQEYSIKGISGRKMVGCIISEGGGVATDGQVRTQASYDASLTSRAWDARLIVPWTNDLIVHSRSGWCVAAFPNTAVTATNFDGTVVNFTVSPGSPVQISSVLSNLQHQNPAGFWRLQATGLIGAISGADGQGGDAWSGVAVNTMSQVLAQPFYLTGSGLNDEVGLTFFGPYEGSVEIWEEDEATGIVTLRDTLAMTRGVGASYPAPAACAFSNDATITNNTLMGGNVKPGFIRSNVPISMVAQSQGGVLTGMRSQGGTTVDGIYTQEDETILYGWTPPLEAAEIRLNTAGEPVRRVLTGTVETWVGA